MHSDKSKRLLRKLLI